MGIRFRSVLCINASVVRVYFQISWLIPHSVSRCNVVSRFPHNEQASDSTKRILCSLVCVGRMSWITTYQADLAPSEVRVL